MVHQNGIYAIKQMMKSLVAWRMEMTRKWVKEFSLRSSVGKPQAVTQLEISGFILCYGFDRKRVQVNRSESSGCNAA